LLIWNVWDSNSEGTWQGAGGALQPEAACAAAQVESHPLRQASRLRKQSAFLRRNLRTHGPKFQAMYVLFRAVRINLQ